MAAGRKYALEPHGEGWRKELNKLNAKWTQRNLDDVHEDICNDVYTRGLNGQRLGHIARWYGVAYREFADVYEDVWALGHSEMQAAIANKTLDAGLNTNQPVSLIWAGKALGGLTDNGSTTTVEGSEDDDGSVNIKVNIVRRSAKDEDGTQEA